MARCRRVPHWGWGAALTVLVGWMAYAAGKSAGKADAIAPTAP